MGIGYKTKGGRRELTVWKIKGNKEGLRERTEQRESTQIDSDKQMLVKCMLFLEVMD